MTALQRKDEEFQAAQAEFEAKEREMKNTSGQIMLLRTQNERLTQRLRDLVALNEQQQQAAVSLSCCSSRLCAETHRIPSSRPGITSWLQKQRRDWRFAEERRLVRGSGGRRTFKERITP